MGALMRAQDWSGSSLGPPESWPQALRTAVRLMLNCGHPMYIWWGADGACLYNDAYRQSIGPERHPGSLGRPAREVWAEIWDIIGPQIEQVMAGRGATWHVNQLVPITRHGVREDVYWTYSYSPIDDDTAPNGVGGVLVVCTETTQQVLSEQRSRNELARFAALFEQAPTFMALLRGPEHRVELANPAYMRLIGHREIIGRKLAEALPETVEQGYIEILDRVRRTGAPYSASGATFAVQHTADGLSDERHLDFVYQPIKDDKGAVTGIFVQGADVTDRATADVIAHRLASIVESSDDAIIGKDLNGVIQSWNKGAERIFGYTEAEAVGRPITMLIPPDLMHEEPEILRRIVKGERIDHFETTRRRKDGALFPISVTISPIRNHAGKIVGASKVVRDVTAMREAQETQALLFREMDHRIKNLFAVAGGVVAVSARSATDPKELAKMIQARLAALARAHNLTMSGGGAAPRATTLAELVRAILSPFDTGSGRILIDGPEVACGSQAVTPLALLLHEFATNSIKYGALSAPSGYIAVRWNDGEDLTLVWEESGGPPLEPGSQDQQGFGSVLVGLTIAGMGGTIERDWQEQGLRIRLSVPRARIVH